MGEVTVFELPLEAWISAFILILLIMLILYITALFRIGRLHRRLNTFLNGSDVTGLEGVIRDVHSKLDRMDAEAHENKAAVVELKSKTAAAKGNLAIMRYNAFGERGSDLSFSVSMLDDEQNGVVISSIHNRGESVVYAKPVQNGTSKYALTPEEKQVIHQATQGKKE